MHRTIRAQQQTPGERRIKTLEAYVDKYPESTYESPSSSSIFSHTQVQGKRGETGKEEEEEEGGDESMPSSSEVEQALATDPDVVSTSISFIKDTLRLIRENPDITDLGLEEEQRAFLHTLVQSLLQTEQQEVSEEDLNTVLALTSS